MSYKQQVMSLMQSGLWGNAKTACARLCDTNCSDPDAWRLMAIINANLGAMDAVVTCFQKVVALQPSNREAHYNLGVALQSQGLHEAAIEIYNQAIKLDPKFALTHANLGLSLRELGKIDLAIDSCHRALHLKPDLAEAMNTLALCLKAQNNIHQAQEYLRAAIKHHPEYAEAYFNMALCHEMQAMHEDAANCYQQALKVRPKYAEAHARIGAILSRLNRIDEAISHYKHALALKPDYAEVYNALGNLLLNHTDPINDYPQAEICFKKAIELRPHLPDGHLNLALMHLETGAFDAAKKHFQKALEISPDSCEAHAGMATLLERQGQHEAGMRLLRPMLAREHSRIFVALAYAALAHHFDEQPEAIAYLKHFEDQALEPTERISLHFALGKLYDEIRDYANAFVHFHIANATSSIGFDKAKGKRTFDDIISVFNKDGGGRRPSASNKSNLPVFIVGMPRSGTSLVEQILSSHPDVYGAGELDNIHRIVQNISNHSKSPLPYPYNVDSLDRKTLDIIAASHLDRLKRFSKKAKRVTDKMPHNFLALGLIDQLFPGARVIHCKRDPVDTCLSIYFHRFNRHHPYACDLDALGFYYRLYERLMDHWKSVLRIPVLDVSYEELVMNTEPVSRALVGFCGLRWDDDCLRFHESKRVAMTPSYDQVRRPIYTQSVARWKRYEPYIKELLTSLHTHMHNP